VGAVIVTTPQSIALSDVRKAVAMFKQLKVPMLGIVENMSEFICPHCKNGSRIFSKGGAKALSEKHLVPFLGEIPLDPSVCNAGENGKPQVLVDPESETSSAFRSIARQVAAQVSLQNHNSKSVEIDLVSKK
jgi:ATP-binding protein involved in chromosome partitioning